MNVVNIHYDECKVQKLIYGVWNSNRIQSQQK